MQPGIQAAVKDTNIVIIVSPLTMSCSKNFDLMKPGSLETTCELNTYLKI